MDSITLRWSNERNRSVEFDAPLGRPQMQAAMAHALRMWRIQQSSHRCVKTHRGKDSSHYESRYPAAVLHMRHDSQWLHFSENRLYVSGVHGAALPSSFAYASPAQVIAPQRIIRTEASVPGYEARNLKQVIELDENFCRDESVRVMELVADTLLWADCLSNGIRDISKTINENGKESKIKNERK